MSRQRNPWLFCFSLACVCLGLVLGGCGAGSPSSSSPGRTTTSHSAGDGTEPSSQFLDPKDSKSLANSVANFGQESSVAEREMASAVVAKSLTARASADFATQCETLSARGITGVPGAKNRLDCPTALKKYAEPLSSTRPGRKDTLSGSISAMRIKGDKGYALYHGNDGKNYAMPVEKEDGTWKVSSVTTLELSSSPPPKTRSS